MMTELQKQILKAERVRLENITLTTNPLSVKYGDSLLKIGRIDRVLADNDDTYKIEECEEWRNDVLEPTIDVCYNTPSFAFQPKNDFYFCVFPRLLSGYENYTHPEPTQA